MMKVVSLKMMIGMLTRVDKLLKSDWSLYTFLLADKLSKFGS